MNRVKLLRDEKRLTQLQLAMLTDTSQQTISRIECNEVVPQGEVLLRLVEYFKVSSDYLLGLTDNRYKIEISKHEYKYKHHELIKLFDRMNEKQQEDWMKFGRYILGDNKE